MKNNLSENADGERTSEIATMVERENIWCEKYGYFIDLDACHARSINRSVCRRCYKTLLQLSLPFGEKQP
jgi:hypothetical protein